MRPHKFTIEKSQDPIKTQGYEGWAFTIQAVYYSSNEPATHVYIKDKDGDPICHPIPGQLESKLVTVSPVSTTLPIYISDAGNGNRIVVYGELSKVTL
tara:strand:- start:12563 stop:12856 length:294 start_codon:yes stop_codon:yes gene_type:complete